MNNLAVPFKQLVERRLWPVALLLVAALVAVPMLLGHSSDAASAGPADTGTTAMASDAQPIVSDASGDAIRRTIGSPKNPFRPAIKAHPTPTATPVPAGTPSSPPSSSGGGSPASGPSHAATPSAPSSQPAPAVSAPVSVPPVSTPAPAPAPTYELDSLLVRWGDPSGPALALRNLKRLKGLPGGNPALVYLGLLGDHKTAVFMVNAGTKLVGDGRCEPSPKDCQTLRLKAGDTEFVTAGTGSSAKQYELDLVKVWSRTTTDRTRALTARAATAAGGVRWLHRHLELAGRYRYDAQRGTLKVIPQAQARREIKAQAARAAARTARVTARAS